MSLHEFDPNCRDCRPALIDAVTGKPLSENDPTYQAMQRLWDKLPLDVQQAYHRVTVKNSTDGEDLKKAMIFVNQLASLEQQ